MTEQFYVPTDSNGVEHAAQGEIAWELPLNDAPRTTDLGQSLILRQPIALLDVFDEVIYRAEPLTEAKLKPDGTTSVESARLLSRANWDTSSATRFALDCAEHVLGDAADVPLPDGTLLEKVITDARKMLDGIALEAPERLGYVARLSALHRLRKERREIEDISLAVLADDEQKDLDALEDLSYAVVIPVTEAVLAAIEALRHHVLPQVYDHVEDKVEEREEHRNLDRAQPLGIPTIVETPFGPLMGGGGSRVLRYEPAWTSAREAARHARTAARDRDQQGGETAERAWQAANLVQILEAR